MKIAVFVALVALGSALGVSARPIGDPQRGEALTQRWCVACHQAKGADVATDAVPSFAWIAGQVRKDPDFIRGFLNHPHAPMPPIDLNQAQIADLIAYFDEMSKR
jgi:mono/diheme cytochrome c family protein